MAAAAEAYNLAHTARCKLQLAADRPDRNLRFILGHAFTLDKLRLRIAEIELDVADEESAEEELNEPVGAPHPRRVSFRNNAAKPSNVKRARSPPPSDQFADLPDTDSDSDSDSDGYDDVEVDNEDDEGLSLQRFESGSARRPQMIDDEGSDDDDEEELKSPPPMPSEDELRMITGSDGDEELGDAYGKIANCPCHGQSGPQSSKLWEIPQKPGVEGPRYAVIAVAT